LQRRLAGCMKLQAKERNRRASKATARHTAGGCTPRPFRQHTSCALNPPHFPQPQGSEGAQGASTLGYAAKRRQTNSEEHWRHNSPQTEGQRRSTDQREWSGGARRQKAKTRAEDNTGGGVRAGQRWDATSLRGGGRVTDRRRNSEAKQEAKGRAKGRVVTCRQGSIAG